MRRHAALLACCIAGCTSSDGGGTGGAAGFHGAGGDTSTTTAGSGGGGTGGSGSGAGGLGGSGGAAGSGGGGLLEVEPFSDTARSKASFGQCLDELMPVLGFAPATSGAQYPLFVWTVGTFAQYDSAEVHVILSEMARRGFVAVSPAYDNFIVNGCPNLREKAMCIYDASQPDSLVAKMCARNDVDCARGILVGGHSQGFGVALMANNYDDRVRALYALGATCDYLFDQVDGLCDPNGATTDTDCAHHSMTTLPSERIRIINGESDEYGTQLEYERICGRSCAPGTMDCLAADGSGWYRVADAAVEDGYADHCFIVNSTDGAWCPGIDAAHPLDVGWAPPAQLTWSLITNLQWLAGFADP